MTTMNNVSRFLFESAIYLDLDPARALRELCDEAEHSEEESAGDAWLLSLCCRQAMSSQQNCNP